MVPLMVTKDVFVVFKSLVKNQCKGKPCNFLPIKPLPPIFFPNFLICFVHLHVSNKFMVLLILIGARNFLVQKLEIRFPAHGVMDVLEIVYP
jgi:hypothetical protein